MPCGPFGVSEKGLCGQRGPVVDGFFDLESGSDLGFSLMWFSGVWLALLGWFACSFIAWISKLADCLAVRFVCLSECGLVWQVSWLEGCGMCYPVIP